ncbi:helix-turn-helix domain-containing protein [Gymnodinialimonas sp.]
MLRALVMDGSGPKVPSISFDTASFDARDRQDAWHTLNAGLFELKSHDVANQEFHASGQTFQMGQAIIGRYAVTGNIVSRVENRLKVEREDLFVLRMHRSGFTKGLMNDGGFEMKSGRFTLFDFHQDLHAQTENVDYLSVTLPYAAIGYDPSRHSGLLQLPMQSSIGYVLRSNLELMFDLAASVTAEESMNLADGFAGLLRGIVARDLKEETVFRRSSQARKVAVHRFITDNLHDPSLDASAICNAIGVSRPVLYRMYEAEGGVARAIVRMRLERTREDLMTSSPERGAITRIARRWAFHDPAHFSRLFRAAFGATPSDVLGSAHEALHPARQRPRSASLKSPREQAQLVNLYNSTYPS